MEAGCLGRQAGSFAEIGIKLMLYAKNCLGIRACKPGCAYVIPAWHVTQKEFWKEFLFFTQTDIGADSRMSSPLAGLSWFDDIKWIGASHLVG